MIDVEYRTPCWLLDSQSDSRGFGARQLDKRRADPVLDLILRDGVVLMALPRA